MRSKLPVAVASIATIFASQVTAAEKPADYPLRPVEIIVSYAASGSLDICVPVLGKHAEKN